MDLSGDTLSAHGSVQTINAVGTGVADATYGYAFCPIDVETVLITFVDYPDGSDYGHNLWPAKISDTKSIGTKVESTGAGEMSPQNFLFDRTFSQSGVVYCTGGAAAGNLWKYTVTVGSTPSVAITTNQTATEGWTKGGASGQSHPLQVNICHVTTPTEFGEHFHHDGMGNIHYWSGPTDNDNVFVMNLGVKTGEITSTIPAVCTTDAHHVRLVYIDKVGDTHRLLAVGLGDRRLSAQGSRIRKSLRTV